MPSGKMANGAHQLRCFCSRTPLLAVYGIDSDGKAFIHIKIYKQGKVYGELICRGGDVKMRCRECYRWYRVFIRDDNTPELNELAVPESIDARDAHERVTI